MLHQRGLTAARILARPIVQASFRRNATQNAMETQLSGPRDNAFNRERLAVKHHAEATAEFWRKLSLYVVIPCLILASANTWVQWNEHWEHQAHMPPISERPQYSYQNLRTKAYPWRGGNKTLFWNDEYNYIPPVGESE